MDGFQPGLLKAVLVQGPDGALVRKTGIMGIVVQGGAVKPGDTIRVRLPAGPHHALERV